MPGEGRLNIGDMPAKPVELESWNWPIAVLSEGSVCLYSGEPAGEERDGYFRMARKTTSGSTL